MNLKTALSIASKYVGTDDTMTMVSLRGGHVQATNGAIGCRLVCPAATADAAADCKELLRVAKAIPSDDIAIKKGRKLVLSSKSEGVKFELRTCRAENEPWFPDLPEAWTTLTAEQAKVLANVVNALDIPDPRFPGVRLTPHCAMVVTGHAALCAWLPGTVAAPVTVNTALFDYAGDGPLKIAVDTRRLFVMEEDGSVRWAQLYADAYPDADVQAMISLARGRSGHRLVVDPAQLSTLCGCAAAVERTKADVCAVTVTDAGIEIETTPDAGVQFSGKLATNRGTSAPPVRVGLRPSLLKQVLTCFDTPIYFSATAEFDPVVLTGGTIPVEALVMPAHLPPPSATPTTSEEE